ncbi:hypothetical protein RJ639_005266 [Escallonia herrerae]|uniref:Ribokinase n=1 Tax=Escallonia herrerae TaxID=1293975 RepID=A0AA89AZ27_9ASTE|nr:hypothetical protein RJ639_012452 [Escallonia herrerae]KAK3020128.1 hypothetical protein RJ639_005266 [Escallonia herrerae]
MRGIASLSPSKHWHPKPQTNPKIQSNTKPNQLSTATINPSSRKVNPLPSFAINSQDLPVPPLVVVGSANADIYVEIDRLPKEGETISARTGQTLAGGKGANQAVCGGKLSYPTYFVGQVGEDAHGKLIAEALESGGVRVDFLSTVPAAPTGHAVVMLQSDGQNSIIIVGGANMSCWPETLSDGDLDVVRNAGIVLLQREIPDSVNIQAAKVGEDAHGNLIAEAVEGGGNSIIIVGGANMSCWPETLSDGGDLDDVRNAGIVLFQREIPDFVNIEAAKVHLEWLQRSNSEKGRTTRYLPALMVMAEDVMTLVSCYIDHISLIHSLSNAARSAAVPVMLDAGGVDAPIPPELLNLVDILSPNETELARLTGMPTESFEQISQAVVKCHELGVKQVLVKLGAKGSALFTAGEEPIKQPIISAAKVLDTTGAGDTFTAAFAVALVEGKSKKQCLRFAAAAASLCVQVKGAIPSMPDRKSVMDLLQSR